MDRNEIELGEPVQVRRRPKAGVVLSVRVSAEEVERLEQLAEARGATLSELAREAITSYLAGGATAGVAVSPWTGTTAGHGPLRLIGYGGETPGVLETGGSVQEVRTEPVG